MEQIKIVFVAKHRNEKLFWGRSSLTLSHVVLDNPFDERCWFNTKQEVVDFLQHRGFSDVTIDILELEQKFTLKE